MKSLQLKMIEKSYVWTIYNYRLYLLNWLRHKITQQEMTNRKSNQLSQSTLSAVIILQHTKDFRLFVNDI